MSYKVTQACPICKLEFTSYKCQNRKVCNRKCFPEFHRRFMKENPNNGQFTSESKAFKGRKHSETSRQKMREKTLQNIAKGVIDIQAMAEKSRAYTTGDKNVNWKGGISKTNRTARQNAANTIRYKRWRTAVFERDNYTCQVCEQHNGALHADHIERWADNEELRYAVDNGRTLCVACHYYITFKKKMKPGQRWCNFTARERG